MPAEFDALDELNLVDKEQVEINSILDSVDNFDTDNSNSSSNQEQAQEQAEAQIEVVEVIKNSILDAVDNNSDITTTTTVTFLLRKFPIIIMRSSFLLAQFSLSSLSCCCSFPTQFKNAKK